MTRIMFRAISKDTTCNCYCVETGEQKETGEGLGGGGKREGFELLSEEIDDDIHL